MAKNPLHQVRINALRSEIGNKNTVKQKLNEQLSDVGIIRNFFKTWLQNVGDPDGGIGDAISSLPDDNPATSEDESISLEEFQGRAEDFFDTPWSEIRVDESGLNENIKNTMSEIRRIIGLRFMINSDIDGLQSEIDDITAIQKSDS